MMNKTITALLFFMFSITPLLYPQSLNFGVSNLAGESSYLPTSLQFGPDGRLYVAQQEGEIYVYTVVRDGVNNYRVTATEKINLIKGIPNHDDNGALNLSVNKRQITGILVVGTAENPVVYVTSSDPRIGAYTQGDVNLDTNSGILSRLTWNGTAWVKLDLVRGLPRSEENHSPNGLQLDKSSNILYIAQGGNTNMGAPSTNFAFTPEFALSGAILSVDLNAIGETTYDLPTLDDEDREGASDLNDPFGGNDGKNQAVLVQEGPVQVYSPGWRNPYDLLIASNGKMYSIDNGANAGWGGIPVDCSNQVVDAGISDHDNLHLITGKGFYAGHPNPTRANRSNTFNSTSPQSPIPQGMENPAECSYLAPGTQDGALSLIPASTNGLTEYTSSKFGGAMKGNLLAAGWDGNIYRLILNDSGTALASGGQKILFSNFGENPLDIIALGDDSPFPGTIWVANIVSSTITIFEPNETGECDLSDANGDADGDGYKNADEQANLTDPCSPASVPPDADGDKISDLTDTDDDNDGIMDTADKFALDGKNGTETSVPVVFTWNNGEPSRGGILNTGFTGLMTNGKDDYLKLFDPTKMTAGGAAGVLTVDSVSPGDAFSSLNNQENAFQFGVNMKTYTGAVRAHTRIMGAFKGFTPADSQSMGMFIGTGDQDNYLKITTASIGGKTGVHVQLENDGVVADAPVTQLYSTSEGVDISGSDYVDLYLTLDKDNSTVQPAYAINGGEIKNLGAAISIPSAWTQNEALAAGIISTSRGGATSFASTWDMIEIKPASTTQNAQALFVVNPGNYFDASTYTRHSFRLTNSSGGTQKITKLRIDARSAILSDLVFDPQGLAGDIVGKGFTADSNAAVVGVGSFEYFGEHDKGYDILEVSFNDFNPGELFTFSIDMDPTSIQGAQPGGPSESGNVSGTELIGSLIQVTFDDGSTYSGELYRIPGHYGGSQIVLNADSTAAPEIVALGVASDTSIVYNSAQTIRVSAPEGSSVSLLGLDAALYTDGLPNGGFDIEPFEANSIVTLFEYNKTAGQDGYADFPVTLVCTNPKSGLNYITAVVNGAGGRTSYISNVLILKLTDSVAADAIRLNAGAFTDMIFNGITFKADNFYTGTFTYSNPNIADIANTTIDELYKTERSSDTDTSSFSYRIPVANGDYLLRLHFAEIYFGAPGGEPDVTAPGTRVFNVDIEGSRALTDFDMLSEAAPMTAIIRNFDVTVTDEFLDINFLPVKNRPKISAIEIIKQVTGVSDDQLHAGKEYRLEQNYPNPFNPATRITYNLAEQGNVRLAIFNLLGERIRVLDDGYKTAGTHNIDFNAEGLASGVYFYRLEAGNFMAMKKMIILK